MPHLVLFQNQNQRRCKKQHTQKRPFISLFSNASSSSINFQSARIYPLSIIHSVNFIINLYSHDPKITKRLFINQSHSLTSRNDIHTQHFSEGMEVAHYDYDYYAIRLIRSDGIVVGQEIDEILLQRAAGGDDDH